MTRAVDVMLEPHCGSATCKASWRLHALVPIGAGRQVARRPADACACLCVACTRRSEAHGIRPRARRLARTGRVCARISQIRKG